MDGPQRPCDVDPPLAVLRVVARLTEIVRRLEDPRANQPGVPVPELRHEERGEARDGWRSPARTDATLERFASPAILCCGLRRGRSAWQPHGAIPGGRHDAAGRGDADRGATERAVWSDRIYVLPRPVKSGRGGRPRGGHADGVRGLARQPHEVTVVIEVGGIIEGDADDERPLPE